MVFFSKEPLLIFLEVGFALKFCNLLKIIQFFQVGFFLMLVVLFENVVILFLLHLGLYLLNVELVRVLATLFVLVDEFFEF